MTAQKFTTVLLLTTFVFLSFNMPVYSQSESTPSSETQTPTPEPTRNPISIPTQAISPREEPFASPTETPTPEATATNPVPTSISPTSPPNFGIADANSDNRVDGVDYTIWLINHDRRTSRGSRDGDFNNDGRVDGVDYSVWLETYGN